MLIHTVVSAREGAYLQRLGQTSPLQRPGRPVPQAEQCSGQLAPGLTCPVRHGGDGGGSLPLRLLAQTSYV